MMGMTKRPARLEVFGIVKQPYRLSFQFFATLNAFEVWRILV